MARRKSTSTRSNKKSTGPALPPHAVSITVVVLLVLFGIWLALQKEQAPAPSTATPIPPIERIEQMKQNHPDAEVFQVDELKKNDLNEY